MVPVVAATPSEFPSVVAVAAIAGGGGVGGGGVGGGAGTKPFSFDAACGGWYVGGRSALYANYKKYSRLVAVHVHIKFHRVNRWGIIYSFLIIR